jgi:predicted nucleic acid-binding protein
VTPPSILLDRGFLVALAHPTAPDHERAVSTYRVLLDDHDHDRHRLVARGDHLAAFDATTRRTLFAPVDALHVAAQHRRAAARALDEPHPEVPELDGDLATTLVLLARERIAAVVSFDPRLSAIEVDVIPAP